jgi:uncharacterized DUF497 family protein
MEFDWTSGFPEPRGLSTTEIEESFEDPFSIRIFPDTDLEPGREARYFSLGRSVAGKALFSVFWTDGKSHRVVFSRPATGDEVVFMDRKNQEASS